MQGFVITLGIDQMIHVIITNPFTYFTDTNVGFGGQGIHDPCHHSGAGLDGIIFPQWRIRGRSYSNIALSNYIPKSDHSFGSVTVVHDSEENRS